jgi:site-specific recombinase XerD
MRATDAPFTEAIESFLRSRHDLRPWTLRSYAKTLERFAERCPTIADFTLELVNAYLAEKIAAGHATEAHHDGGTARRFAGWLVRAKILTDDPLETLTIPKQPKRRRAPFTDDQVPLILAAARGGQQPERDVTIVAIALCCGLRKDEIRQLNWPDDVELTRKVLWVRDAKTDAGIRCVPITNPAVVAQIDGYVKDWRPSQSSGPLFLNRHGDPFSYDGFSQIFTRIKKRLPASLDFKIHRARNTALTNWRRGGADIELIAQLAGHSDIAHTKIYLGALTPEELARVPDAFGRFYGRKAI